MLTAGASPCGVVKNRKLFRVRCDPTHLEMAVRVVGRWFCRLKVALALICFRQRSSGSPCGSESSAAEQMKRQHQQSIDAIAHCGTRDHDQGDAGHLEPGFFVQSFL